MHPVEIWQSQVEKHQFEVVSVGLPQRTAPGADPSDLVVVGMQTVGEQLADGLIVLDHQQVGHVGNPTDGQEADLQSAMRSTPDLLAAA